MGIPDRLRCPRLRLLPLGNLLALQKNNLCGIFELSPKTRLFEALKSPRNEKGFPAISRQKPLISQLSHSNNDVDGTPLAPLANRRVKQPNSAHVDVSTHPS
jgi:hypothetical protein